MSIVKKIGFLTLGQGINVFVNLLFLPYMSRALTYEEYGSYGQVLLIVSALATLVSVGLPQIINVYLADNNRSHSESLTNNISASIFSSFLGFLLLYFLSDFFGTFFNNPKLPSLIRLYSFSVLFSVPFASINSYLIFTGQVKKSVYLSVFPNILKIVLVVVSIQWFNSLEYALFGIILATFIQFSFSLFQIRKVVLFKLNRSKMYQQLIDGLPLGMTGIIGMIILYTDSIMVSNMIGVKEYAIYRNGAIEVPFISTIYGAISAIILPEVAKLWNANKIDEIFVLKKKVVMNMIYLLYPILIYLIFNSRELISLYFGEMYIESALIFSVFNLTLLFRISDYGDILIAAKKGRAILYFYLIVFVVNLISNYLLIKFFGALGASISTVLSLSLLVVLQLQKSLKISSKKLTDFVNLRRLFIVLSSCVGIASLLALFTSYIENSITELIIFTVLYFAIVLMLFIYLKYYTSQVYAQIIPERLKKLFKK